MLPPNETLLSFKEITTLPRLAKLRGGVSLITVYRWASLGVGGIKLETTKVGGLLATSEEAISRFFKRLEGGVARGGSAIELPPAKNSREAEIEKSVSNVNRKVARRRPRKAALAK